MPTVFTTDIVALLVSCRGLLEGIKGHDSILDASDTPLQGCGAKRNKGACQKT